MNWILKEANKGDPEPPPPTVCVHPPDSASMIFQISHIKYYAAIMCLINSE